MKMLRYIAKRLLMALFVLFCIATFTFWLSRAIPGGPFDLGDKPLPTGIVENLEKKYGLDKPLIEQYLRYMKNLCRLDFGVSMKEGSKTVNYFIETKFPISFTLGLGAFLIAVLVGIPSGVLSAMKQNKWQDNTIKVLTTLWISIPSFVAAIVLRYYVAYKWKLFGLQIAGWGTWKHAVLPMVALSLGPMAQITKYMKSCMLEVMNEDYIRTARAKGASKFRVTYIHTLRNALIPILTILGPMFAGIICGSLVIEQVFAIPGLGAYFTSSIFDRDYTMIMGLTVFYSAILVVMLLIVDILYTIVDPRISLIGGKEKQ